MIFSPKTPGNTQIETEALQQINALRSSLDYIRSTYRRGTLTHSVSNALASMAALREELEDAIASDEGDQLIAIAEKLVSDRIEADGEAAFAFNHARSNDSSENPTVTAEIAELSQGHGMPHGPQSNCRKNCQPAKRLQNAERWPLGLW